MKIAVVTSFPAVPEQPRGGVETVSVNLVRALVARGDCEVHVVTADAKVTSASAKAWAGATIHRLPRGNTALLRYVTGEGRRRLREFLDRLQPEVVHAHDFYDIMVQGFPWPRVGTIHGFIHEDTRYSRSRWAWLRSKLWKRIEVTSWREQPHLISISPYVRARLQGIARGCVHDIENPIAPECFSVAHAPEPGVIFSAAVICERKNTLGLVRAVARLAQRGVPASLRLAGPAGDEAYAQAVRECVKENGLTERVNFLGSLSAAQVRGEFARASVFALVSFEEGAPMGVAEAMAAGVPVVTSNRCGMPYMIRDGQDGFLIDPNNVEEIADKLAAVLGNPDLASRFGASAKSAARNRYHPELVAAKTVAVYRQAMGVTQETTARDLSTSPSALKIS